MVRGEFIDTYRGEIITDEGATTREKDAVSGIKASYLYTLDKHAVEDDDDSDPNAPKRSECYVVDGELQGGPTRFINHSCDPNVRQFTVSYNKYDSKIYELAFFALQDIKEGTELTFDYMDKDEEDEEDIPPASQGSTKTEAAAMECHCGSRNCRRVLWM